MTDRRETIDAECAATREALHELFDEAGPGRVAPEHLDRCSACRDWARDHGEVRRALQKLEQPGFPDDALQEVWARTVDRQRAGWTRSAWTWAAAAAVLVAVIGLGLWGTIGTTPTVPPRETGTVAERPTDEEIRKAAEDVRMVFALASRAVRRSERVAVERVLAGEVAPALDRIMVDWPAAGSKTEKGRNGV
jgi:predicted anti-sigma-YlaC factor YlaD